MLLDLFNFYRVEAQHIVSVVLALAIWRWGAAPEKWAIGLFVTTMVVPFYVGKWMGVGHLILSPYASLYVAIDIIATVGFVALALNANRNYPLWVAGFQLVAIGAHAVRGLVDAVSPVAYMFLAAGPSYCQLLLIGGGFLRHVGRTRQFGPYREWRLAAPGTRGLSR